MLQDPATLGIADKIAFSVSSSFQAYSPLLYVLEGRLETSSRAQASVAVGEVRTAAVAFQTSSGALLPAVKLRRDGRPELGVRRVRTYARTRVCTPPDPVLCALRPHFLRARVVAPARTTLRFSQSIYA